MNPYYLMLTLILCGAAFYAGQDSAQALPVEPGYEKVKFATQAELHSDDYVALLPPPVLYSK